MRVSIGFDIFDAEDPTKRLEGKELEAVVDNDIRRFEQFMMAQVDNSGPLSGPEKAIIKTYLYYKTVVQPSQGTHPLSIQDDPGDS